MTLRSFPALIKNPLVWISVFLMLLVLTIDTFTPLGYVDSILYIFPLILITRLQKNKLLILTALLCTILVLVGFVFSPKLNIPESIPIINRLLSIFTIWAITYLLQSRIIITQKLKYIEHIKKLKEIAEEGKQILDTIMENIPSLIVVTDAEGKVKIASQKFYEYTDGTSLNVLGRKIEIEKWGFNKLGKTENSTNSESPFERVLSRENSIRDEEWVVKQKDSEERMLLLNAVSIRDRNNKVIGGVSNWLDITEREKVKRSYLESEEKYRLLFEKNLDGIAYHKIIVDSVGRPIDYKFLDVNISFENFTGLKRENILGRTAKDVLPGIERDPANWIGQYGSVALEGKVLQFEQFSENLQKWFHVVAFSPDKDEFCTVFEDITLRKNAENVLLENERKLSAIINGVNETIILMDQQGKILAVNESAALSLNCDTNQLLGKVYFDLLPPKVRESQFDQMQIMIKANKPIRFEEEREGNFYEYTLYPLRNSSGNILEQILIRSDITESKKSEIVLRESEQRFRNLFENSKAIMLLIDPDSGLIIDANKSACSFYGYLHEELCCMHIQDINQLPPDEIEELRKRAFENKQEHFTFPHKRKNGTIRWVDVYSSPVNISNKTVLFSIIHDVTRRKEVETQLQYEKEFVSKIINSSNAVIVTLDKDGNILQFNPAAEKMTGYTSLELLGKAFFDYLIIPEEKRKIQDTFELMKAGKIPLEGENYWQDKSGGSHYLRFANALLTDANGDVLQVISTGIDITDRKESEKRILKLNDELREQANHLLNANRELESFAYSISHDLRTPLRSLMGFSNILLEDYGKILDTTGKDYLVRIDNAVKRMNSLINDLLSLSEINRQSLTLKEVNLSEIVKVILYKLTSDNPTRNVEIKIQENVIANVDTRLIKIVLENIISNAWKFTSKMTYVTIEFGATTIDSKTVYLIRDNGVGFDPNLSGKLFSPFQKLHSENEFEGTGIGLAIAERIIRKHNGKIWAEGDVNKGATIFFSFN